MLQSRIAYQFKNAALLKDALTHPSTFNKNKRPSSYERMEFLGDRVLGLVIAESLLEKFPNEPEGALAKRLTGLVREEALARIAHAIQLDRSLRVAGDEECNQAVMADACEALIGALYLDGGMEAAKNFITREWQVLFAENPLPPEDPKNTLQEWVQGRGQDLPLYEIINQTGPAHQPHFTVRVTIKDYPPAIGEGSSRRAAEKEAAQAMISRLESKK